MKRNLLLLAQLSTSSIILIYLYNKVALSDLLAAIENIPRTTLVTAFIMNFTGVVLVNVAQVHTQLRFKKPNCSFKDFLFILRTDLAFRFTSLFLPLVGSAGLKVLRYRRYGIGVSESLDLVVINKLVQLTLVSWGVFLFLLWSQARNGDSSFSPEIAALFCAITVCTATHFLYFRQGKPLLIKLVSRLTRAFYTIRGSRERASVEPSFQKQRSRTPQTFRYSAKLWFYIYLLQAMSLLVVAYSQYELILAIKINLSFADAVFLRCVVLVAMLIPISYAGLGIRELGTVGALALFAVPLEASLTIASVLLIFQLCIAFIGAIVMICEGTYFWKTDDPTRNAT